MLKADKHDMMDDGKFWLGFWAIIGATIVLFALVTASTVVKANRQYYAAQSECVQKGGTWVPTVGNNNAVCLQIGERK